MMHVRASSVLILGCGIFLFLAGVQSTYAAFGISPPFLNADHLTPGAAYEQTVYLVQDQPNEDIGIQAVLTVPDAIRSWITIEQGFNFIIPKGVRQFPVNITVHIPKDTGLGKYSGNLVFSTVPVTAGQVTIALGANVAINLTVGNDIFEKYSLPVVQFPSIEEGWNPRVFVRFVNEGNVSEGLDSAIFDIYDQFDAVRLAYMTKQSGFPQTPAFATQEYTLEFPTDFHLGVGDYWGNVSLYKDGKVVASLKTIFHVLPRGSLSTPLEKFIQSLRDNWIYSVVALIAILLIVWRIVSVRRKKNKSL